MRIFKFVTLLLLPILLFSKDYIVEVNGFLIGEIDFIDKKYFKGIPYKPYSFFYDEIYLTRNDNSFKKKHRFVVKKDEIFDILDMLDKDEIIYNQEFRLGPRTYFFTKDKNVIKFTRKSSSEIYGQIVYKDNVLDSLYLKQGSGELRIYKPEKESTQ